MTFVTKEKFLSKEWFYSYSLIAIGSFILAAGFVYFIDPHKIVPGGVYGIGIVVKNITFELMVDGIKIPFFSEPIFKGGLGIGFVGLLLNIPLTIIGIKVLGPRFGIKTVVGFILASVFIDILDARFSGVLRNGVLHPGLVDDVLLSCVFGGVLIGFGLGLIFKSRATSGGSDIIAMIAAKYTKMSLGLLIIIIDSIIVLFGLLVFKDWKIPLYSWIVIYITGKVIDATMQGVSYDKALFIISDKYEEIKEKIIKDLNRGGTILHGTGMYKGLDKKIIFTNVNRREQVILQDFIKDIDPQAFMTVIDAHEVLGNGFKPIREV